MAQSAAECAEMVAACRAAGVRLSVVSQHRFRDAPVAAKRLIDDGAIGEVRMIQVTGAEVGWWDLDGPRRRMEARSAPADRLGVVGRPQLRPAALVQRRRRRARLRPDHELLGRAARRRPERGGHLRDDLRRPRPDPDELRVPATRHPARRGRGGSSARRGSSSSTRTPVVRLGQGDGWERRRRAGRRSTRWTPRTRSACAPTPASSRTWSRRSPRATTRWSRGEEGRNTTAMLDAAERSAASGTSAAVA